MPLIFVGGQTKDVGKTTLACSIIAAFPRFGWTAAKVSTHVHNPPDCELVRRVEGGSIWRETRAGKSSDTARFLAAGAKRAFLIETSATGMKSACDALLKGRDRQNHVIVESSSAAEFLDPDLFLMLVDSGAASFKKSTIDQLSQADAVIRRGRQAELPAPIRQAIEDKPTFGGRVVGLDRGLHSLISSLLEDSG